MGDPSPSRARLVIHDASGFTGVWREIHFDVWKTPGTAAQIRGRFVGQQELLQQLARESGPKKIVTVAIVSDEAARPLEGESRKAVDEGVALTDGRVKASAVVIQARGFKAVMIRSVLAALMLMQKTAHPTRSFTDVEEMFEWLASFVDPEPGSGRPFSADDVRAAFADLNEQAQAKAQA